MLAIHNVQPLPRCRSPRILQDHCAIEHICLFLVVPGYRPAQRRRPRIKLGNQLGISLETDLHRLSHSFARQVVLGWPESAHNHDDIRSRQRISYRVRQMLQPVADDRLERDVDAQLVQPLSYV